MVANNSCAPKKAWLQGWAGDGLQWFSHVAGCHINPVGIHTPTPSPPRVARPRRTRTSPACSFAVCQCLSQVSVTPCCCHARQALHQVSRITAAHPLDLDSIPLDVDI